ncbi:MAG: SufD family Fe-S cluster assembly protein [Candidatus Diapherotrites archaeon]|nr:SufD family Fe-S cluster assembly protein [Candidatus Diapherotrites archaeon]
MMPLQESVSRHNEPEWMNAIRLQAMQAYSKIPLLGEPDSPIVKHLMRLTDFNPATFEVSPQKGNTQFPRIEEKGMMALPLLEAACNYPERVQPFFGQTVSFMESKMDALHYALWKEGLFVWVGKNQELEPVTINFEGTGGNAFFHSLIVLEEGARAQVTYRFGGNQSGEFLHKDVEEIFMEPHSRAQVCSLQNLGPKAHVFSSKKAVLENNARLNYVHTLLGGRNVKQKIDVVLAQAGAQANSSSAFFGNGAQKIDIETNAFHLKPHTTSRVLNHSVLTEEAYGVIRGILKVLPGATESDCDWHSHTLLSGEKSRGNSLPTLDIHTNDVKAAHGSVFSQISPEELFYIQSRGMPLKEAQRMILEGYLEPVIRQIQDVAQQNEIRNLVEGKIIHEH